MDRPLLDIVRNTFQEGEYPGMVHGDNGFILGNAQFIYKTKISKKIGFPVYVTGFTEFILAINGQYGLEYTERRDDICWIEPEDWLSGHGFGVANDPIVFNGVAAKTVFKRQSHDRYDLVAAIFENCSELLCVVGTHEFYNILK